MLGLSCVLCLVYVLIVEHILPTNFCVIIIMVAAKNDWQMDINQCRKMQVLVLVWHRVPRVVLAPKISKVIETSIFRSEWVLTPKISRVIETPIFRSGWLVGITPYAQFCPIPSPPYLHFFHLCSFC